MSLSLRGGSNVVVGKDHTRRGSDFFVRFIAAEERERALGDGCPSIFFFIFVGPPTHPPRASPFWGFRKRKKNPQLIILRSFFANLFISLSLSL
jgi:hypothetical protein